MQNTHKTSRENKEIDRTFILHKGVLGPSAYIYNVKMRVTIAERKDELVGREPNVILGVSLAAK